MRRISTLVAALATVFSMGGANALDIIIDDFTLPTPAQVLIDSSGTTAAQSGAYTATYTPPLGLSATVLATQRIASINQFTSALGGNSTLTLGSPLGASDGVKFNQGSGETADALLEWTIPAGSLSTASAVSMFYTVFFSNPGTPNLSNTLQFNFAGGAGSFSHTEFLPNVPLTLPNGVVQSFTLDASEIAKFNGGGTLNMAIIGQDALDLTFGKIGLRIPEPASLALVGLALVGAGLASRRRKA